MSSAYFTSVALLINNFGSDQLLSLSASANLLYLRPGQRRVSYALAEGE